MVSHNEALLSTPASQVPNPYDPDKNIMDTTFPVRGELLYVESDCRDDRQWQEQRDTEMNSSQSLHDYDVKPESYVSAPIKSESPEYFVETHSSNQAGYGQYETAESTYDQALNHTLWDHPFLRDHYSNKNRLASAAQEPSAAQVYQDHHLDQYYDSHHRQSQLHEGQYRQDQHYPNQENVDQYSQNQEYLVEQYPDYHREHDHSCGHDHYTAHQRDYHQLGQQQYEHQEYEQHQCEHQQYEGHSYDHQFIDNTYNPYPAVLRGQAAAYSQVHAGTPSQNNASPRTRGFASVPMSNTPDFNFVDSSIRPVVVQSSEPQTYVSPYGHMSPHGNYHPRYQADVRDRESPGTDAPSPGRGNPSSVAPQISSPPDPVPDAQPQQPSAKKDFHKSWRPAPKNTTKCDICNSRAFAQTVHQRCTRCTVVICRTCVEAGHMRNLPDHEEMDVFDFNWGKMRPSWRMVKRNNANARSNRSAADYADQPTNTSFLSSKNTPDSARRQSKLEHRGHFSSSDTANEPAPSAPAKQAIPASTYYVDVSDQEDDHDEVGDMRSSKNSPSSDGASSGGDHGDRDYKPASNEGFFSEPSPSRERPSEFARGESEKSTTPGFVKSLGSVGLANSRPVRTSSLVTYERMRAQPYQRHIEQPDLDTRDDAVASHRRREKARKEKNHAGPHVSFVEAHHVKPQLDIHAHANSLHCQNRRLPVANGTPLVSPSTQPLAFAKSQTTKFESMRKMLFFQIHATLSYDKVLIQHKSIAQGENDKEKDLLIAVTNFWHSHQASQALRAADEVEAFAVMRAHVNIAIRRLNIEIHEKLDQWLNTTEKDVQGRSGRFVPNAMKPQDPETNVLHEDLNYCVTPEDILAANALLSMRFS